MRIDPTHQLITAVASLLLGAAAGILYDFFRILRRRLKNKGVTLAADVIFCVSLCLALFLLGYSLGDGEHRLYMTALALAGAVLYGLTLSRPMRYLFNLFASFIYKLIGIAVFPFRKLLYLMNIFQIFIKNSFYYRQKWYTMSMETSIRVQKRRKPDEPLKGNTYETEKGKYYY